VRRDADIRSLRAAIDELRSVAGHLRRLQPGSTASSEAEQAARAAGIRVPPGYTWVRPHRRGADAVFRVRWPPSLALW
jgi:hypothetical protein